jgi:CheY-like chemotaxis protein
VYGIVKQSGGYIWVYSELGQGTTFKIYFPRVASTPERPDAAAGAALLVGGSETVLVAEDQPEVRQLTTRVLELRGYTVLGAASGEEALDLAAQYPNRIQILVTDVIMPGISGRELARRLLATRDGLKVLFVSGYTNEAIHHRGLLEPGGAFLQKPFTGEALARKVREVLDSSDGPST